MRRSELPDRAIFDRLHCAKIPSAFGVSMPGAGAFRHIVDDVCTAEEQRAFPPSDGSELGRTTSI
jgi:hypothetical protein